MEALEPGTRPSAIPRAVPLPIALVAGPHSSRGGISPFTFGGFAISMLCSAFRKISDTPNIPIASTKKSIPSRRLS